MPAQSEAGYSHTLLLLDMSSSADAFTAYTWFLALYFQTRSGQVDPCRASCECPDCNPA